MAVHVRGGRGQSALLEDRVGIEEQDVPAPALGKDLVVGGAEAPVLLIGGDVNRREPVGDNGGAPVGGGVVNHEDLRGHIPLAQDGGEAGTDEIGGLVGDNDHGYINIHVCS